MVGGLEALALVGVGEGVVRGVARGGRPVFVFPGQGAQWEGMAVELLDSSAVFGDALRVCGEALEGLVDWRVEDVLRGVEGAPGLERVDVVQPVSFAVMVALAELWRSFGVRPAVVVGHSQGEIAAACVAGGLSLGDAARVVVLRSRLLGEVLAGRGGMVSVALGVGEVQERLGGWGGRLSVAAVNGPRAVVVSGEAEALEELLGCVRGMVCGRGGSRLIMRRIRWRSRSCVRSWWRSLGGSSRCRVGCRSSRRRRGELCGYGGAGWGVLVSEFA